MGGHALDESLVFDEIARIERKLSEPLRNLHAREFELARYLKKRNALTTEIHGLRTRSSDLLEGIDPARADWFAEEMLGYLERILRSVQETVNAVQESVNMFQSDVRALAQELCCLEHIVNIHEARANE